MRTTMTMKKTNNGNVYLDEDYASVKTEPNEKMEFDANSQEGRAINPMKLGYTDDLARKNQNMIRTESRNRFIKNNKTAESGVHSTRSVHSSVRIAEQVRGLNSDYQSSLSLGRVLPFIDFDLSSRQFVLSSKGRSLCRN